MEEYLQLLDETGEARRDSGASDRMQQNTPAAASAGVEEQYITQEKKFPRSFGAQPSREGPGCKVVYVRREQFEYNERENGCQRRY